MTVETRTIIAGGGGDYTTIAAWDAAVNLNSGADIWKGVISDNSDYDESFNWTEAGTSATSYQWLTVASGNRHAGVWDTGKARIDYTGSAPEVFEFNGSDWARLDWLQIKRSGSIGNNDRGLRLSNADNVLLEYLVMWSSPTKGNSDAVFVNSASSPTSTSNCVFYNWGKTGTGTGNTSDKTVNLDHNTAILVGVNNAFAVLGVNAISPDTATLNAYNNVLCETLTGSTEIGFVDGTVVLNGSNNVVTANNGTYIDAGITNNATAWQEATDQVVDTAPATAGVYITDVTVATLDATPIDHANNVLIGNGVNRQGSEPDPRQDFSVAVNGARPTTNVDIGAFQISTAGGVPNEGTAAHPVDVSVAATGARDSDGSAAHPVDVSVAAVGARDSDGTAAHPVDLTVVATGSRASDGSAAHPINLTVTAVGVAPALANEGTAAHPVDLTVAATGARDSDGTAAHPVDLTVTATGTRDSDGSAAHPVDLSIAAAGSRNSDGTAAHPINLTVTAVGQAPGGPSVGIAAHPIDVSVAAAGARPSDGSTVHPVDVSVAATGARVSDGSAGHPINLTVTAVGEAPVVGAADGTAVHPIDLTVTAAGERLSLATAAHPVDLVVSAVGDRTADATAAFPINLTVTAVGQATPIAEGTVEFASTATQVIQFCPTPEERVEFV